MPYADRVDHIPTRLIIGLANTKAMPRKLLLPRAPGRPRIFPVSARIMDGDWDLKFTRLEDSEVYHKLYQFIHFGIPQRFSNNLTKAHGGKNVIFGKAPDVFYHDADSRLIDMIESIRRGDIVGLGEDEDDEPNFLVTRRGDFLLYDGGRNRTILAVMLGVKELSGNILVRHTTWADKRHKLMSATNHYQELMHPDLRLVVGSHTRERAESILSLTRDMSYFDASHKTMIDVGSNWGIMCDVFEDAGFVCLAMEGNATTAKELKEHRASGRRQYGIIHAISALDITCPWRADVVLMLNIAHHLYAQDPKKFRSRLRSIDANKIIFTAPNHFSSFKTENDFAQWISDNIAFPHRLVSCGAEGLRLAKYPEGRTIYSIDRMI